MPVLAPAAGAGRGRGLCLLPGGRARNNAAETRWLCTPVPGGCGRQLWELVKNKRGRLGVWEVGQAEAPRKTEKSPAAACA